LSGDRTGEWLARAAAVAVTYQAQARDDQRGHVSMDVNIKVSVGFRVSESSLEDALAEYDELTVEGLLREIIDKAIACDEISTKVDEGPNTLEDLDSLKNR
jgi:hypothetical protein